MMSNTSSPHHPLHLRQHTSRMMLSPQPNAGDSLNEMASSPAPVMITSQELHELEGQVPSAPHPQPPSPSSVPLPSGNDSPVMIDRTQLKKLVACHRCNELPRDPVESVCCGKIYCWECAVLQTEEKTCSCGANLAIGAWKPAKAVERMIRENAVETPQLPNRVPCPECGKTFARKKIEAHLHTCDEVLLPCSHCFVQVKRGQLANHVNTDCPLAAVKCPFGCEDQLLRREMDDHLEGNVQKHLSMLQQTVARQQVAIEKLEADANRSVFERIGNMNLKHGLVGLVVLLVLMWLRLRVTPMVIVFCFFAGLFLKLVCPKKCQRATNAAATASNSPGAQTNDGSTTSDPASSQPKKSSCVARALMFLGIVCFLFCVF